MFRKELLLLFLLTAAAPSRRVLHVSLYPFIPEAPAAALALIQAYQQAYPDVILRITFNPNYYSPNPADKGVLYEDADVHEIDSIFLRDFIDRKRLAVLPAGFTDSLGPFDKPAAQVVTTGGRMLAVPHWLCADFLIYRADKKSLADAKTLAALETALGPEHGLLMDMKGDAALGELYLNALLPQNTAISSIAQQPDPAILARFRRMLAMEPPGLGRNAAYDAVESFYARQFARRIGSAFLGYSEMTHDVMDETATACRVEDRCVQPDEIRVTAFPFQDATTQPAIWVDMLGIDARVRGATFTDAENFIRLAVSLPTYRALLIPQEGDAPRYLLPATEAAFKDPAILRAAPLYPKFRAILDQGTAITAPHLNAALHAVAAQIDAALPRTH